MALLENEFDIPDHLLPELLPKLGDDLRLPGAVEFVANTRLNNTDHESSRD
jgi:hypothetical protein